MPNEINRPRTRTRQAIPLVAYEPDTIIAEVDLPPPAIGPDARRTQPIERVTMKALVFGEVSSEAEHVGIRVFVDEDTAPHALVEIEPLLHRCRPGVERLEKRARDLEARHAMTVGDAVDPDHVRVVARAARDRDAAIRVLGRIK